MIKRILFFLAIFFFLRLSLPKSVLAASLSFSPSQGSHSLNESFSVNVILNTNTAQVDGVDALINFDATKLQVSSATLGTLFTNKLTESASGGTITFRATSAAGSPFVGSGTLATIVFKGISQGTANVNFNFTPGSTVDSNVASAGSDVLSSVGSASFTISAATAAPAIGGASSPTPSPSPSTPVAGNIEPTIALLFAGISLVLLPLLSPLLRKIVLG